MVNIPGIHEPTLKACWNYKPPQPFPGGGSELPFTAENSQKIRELVKFCVFTKADEEWTTGLKVTYSYPYPIIQYVLHNEVRLIGTQSNNWALGSQANIDSAIGQPDYWLHIAQTTSTGAGSGSTTVPVADLTKVQNVSGGASICDVYQSNGTTYLGRVHYTARSGSSGPGTITIPGSGAGSIAVNISGASIPAGAILKSRIKTTPSSSTGAFLGNPDSSGYRTWLLGNLTSYRAADPDNDRWDGVFLDNVDIDGHLALDAIPGNVMAAEYADVAEYLTGVNSLVSWMDSNLPGVLWGNTVVIDSDGSDWAATSAALDDVIPFLDGIMFENYPLDFQGIWPGATRFNNALLVFDKLTALGKGCLMIGRLDTPGDYPGGEMAEFALAAFLLAWDEKFYCRISETDSYPQWFPYDQFWWRLGRPTQARQVAGNVHTRTFEYGSVTLNAVAQTATITRTIT